MLQDFNAQFKKITDNLPFPWQEALYERFISGGTDNIPATCVLPTGLGKTSIIAIWLLALINGAKLPRRLVYVVNRRTVVDQTTTEVEKIRNNLEKIGKSKTDLAISTLRGQYADNREWSADPSKPAVICGTVDMIGSRLLFNGYGVGFKGRPLHAGFLGQDSLIVHDEAHLEPAFQQLLVAIQAEQRAGRFPDRQPLRVMELSATSRDAAPAFELTAEEKNADVSRTDAPPELQMVWRRTQAKKTLKVYKVADEKNALVEQLAKLALMHKDSGCAILVFVHTVDNLTRVVAHLSRAKAEIRQLTGTMRGLERDALVDDPVFKRFLPGATADDKSVYLVCTSAGEVGVNLSADHLVCDLTTFESMAQRFGRVNRFGRCDDTQIDVVCPATFDEKHKLTPARQKTLALLESLPDGLASPAALSNLDRTLRAEAFAPIPAIIPTTDILFDAWSLTSIRDNMPGRPPVEPFLHGIAEWEPPQTKVAWRSEVSVITGDLLDEYPPEELLEAYPLKPHEILTDRSDRIFKTLTALQPEHDSPVWVVDEGGKVIVKTLSSIVRGDKEVIAGKTVLLAPELGGLNDGFFTDSGYDPLARYDVADELQDAAGPMRQRLWQMSDEGVPEAPPRMKPVQRIAIYDPDDIDARPVKTWHWFVRTLAADADARSSRSYGLQPHLVDAKTAAERIVSSLDLAPKLRQAVILAAALHDLGKDRQRWQNGIGNDCYPEKTWAKSGKRLRRAEVSAYRHEFGSVLDVKAKDDFKTLSPEMQDLVLHLIAAHHGRARPHFEQGEAFDDQHNAQAALDLATETPRRFARLQRKFGRWGLAYLESLVRAADYAASRKAEEEGAK